MFSSADGTAPINAPHVNAKTARDETIAGCKDEYKGNASLNDV